MSPINPPAPKPTPVQRAVQVGRSVTTSSWFGTILGAIVGGGIAIAAGILL